MYAVARRITRETFHRIRSNNNYDNNFYYVLFKKAYTLKLNYKLRRYSKHSCALCADAIFTNANGYKKSRRVSTVA